MPIPPEMPILPENAYSACHPFAADRGATRIKRNESLSVLIECEAPKISRLLEVWTILRFSSDRSSYEKLWRRIVQERIENPRIPSMQIAWSEIPIERLRWHLTVLRNFRYQQRSFVVRAQRQTFLERREISQSDSRPPRAVPRARFSR